MRTDAYKTYLTWRDMQKRCRNPKDQNYHSYGGRGIIVCERWNSFKTFLADMGKRPEGMSLDRIDNDGNYEPGNCRWATLAQQVRNTRRTVKYTFNGITRCARDWEIELGLTVGGLWHRFANGWTLERALTTKASAHHQHSRKP